MKPKIVLVGVGRFGKNHLRVLKELEKEKSINYIEAILYDGVLKKDSEISVANFDKISAPIIIV